MKRHARAAPALRSRDVRIDAGGVPPHLASQAIPMNLMLPLRLLVSMRKAFDMMDVNEGAFTTPAAIAQVARESDAWNWLQDTLTEYLATYHSQTTDLSTQPRQPHPAAAVSTPFTPTKRQTLPPLVTRGERAMNSGTSVQNFGDSLRRPQVRRLPAL
jgi:hypothetical protein